MAKSDVEDADFEKRELRSRFFVPQPDDELFASLDQAVATTAEPYRRIAAAFRASCSAMVSTVSVPFLLASAGVHQKHFQKFHIAARIRTLPIGTDEDLPEKEREEVAFEDASERFKEFGNSSDGREAIIKDIYIVLMSVLGETALEPAISNLHRQGAVLLWSAFEVLFRDTFEHEINRNPAKVGMILEDASLRKRLNLDKLSMESVLRHEFDLTNKIGTLLLEQQDVGDLPTIKSVSSALFPKVLELKSSLNDRDLWLLYQRRHLVVHRQGIIDQHYLSNTGEDVVLGTSLDIKPTELEAHLMCVAGAAEALINCMGRGGN